MKGESLRDLIGVDQRKLDYLAKKIRRLAIATLPRGMATMNSKKTNPSSPLERLEDALVDSILNMSESELDAELREMNLDPNDVAIRTKAAIDRGIVAANKASLARARNQLAEAKGRLSISTTSRDRAGALARFEKMKAGDRPPNR